VGCAILPASTFENGDRPNVVKIPLTGPVVKRRVTLLRRKPASLSPAAGAFHALTLQHFGKAAKRR